MANLRVDKITSTETFETTGSVQISAVSGNENFLDVNGTNSDLALGTGDFTIESYFYIPAYDSASNFHLNVLIDFRPTSTNDVSPTIYIQGSSDQSPGQIRYLTSGSDRITGDSGQVLLETWHHFALVRSNGVTKLYLNGVQTGADYADSNDYICATNRPRIGGNGYLATIGTQIGYTSNFRILKGIALYTSNFKLPMREFEVTPETVLLACQSKTDATLEKTGKTLSATGEVFASEITPGLLTPVPKSGAGSAITGSVEFTGDPNHLTVPNTEDLRLADSDFTVEAYINFSNGATSNGVIVALWDNTNNQRSWNFYFDRSANVLYFAGSTNGSSGNNHVTASIDIEDGEWYHVAASRSGSTLKLFVNGVELASNTSVGTYYDNTTDLVTIGAQNHDNDTFHWKGFISNLRIVKGTALYTDDFIPPTRELKKVPGTVLLCCQDSNDPTQEATGKTISLNGLFDTGDVVSSGITTTPVSSNFTPQVGDDRKVTFEGVTKINSDAYFYLPTGDTVTRDTRSGRGIFGGGQSPSRTDAINFIQIQSTGNTQDFGDLTVARDLLSACASSTRGIFGGGYLAPPSTYLNVMEFVTMASTGDALDFGDLSVDRQGPGSCSNSTRGVFAGGSDPGNLNTIDFVTIASTGDATDFGDLITKRDKHRGCGSSIRAIIFSPEPGEDIQFFNYASTGRATSFGEITPGTKGVSGAASDSTRALRFGGGTHPEGDVSNNISYITISSTGNEQEFGDLSAAGSSRGTAMSNSIRAVQILNNANGQTNVMEYVTIQSTGNGKNFGDLNTTHLSNAGSTSDSHGGLG